MSPDPNSSYHAGFAVQTHGHHADVDAVVSARLTPMLRERDDSDMPGGVKAASENKWRLLPASPVPAGSARQAMRPPSRPSSTLSDPMRTPAFSTATGEPRPVLTTTGLRDQAITAIVSLKGLSSSANAERSTSLATVKAYAASEAVPFPSPPPMARKLASAPGGVRARKVAMAASHMTGSSDAAGRHAPVSGLQSPRVSRPVLDTFAISQPLPLEPGLTLEGVEAAQRSLRAAHTQKTAMLRVQELTLPLHARNPYTYTGGGRWTSTKVTTLAKV